MSELANWVPPLPSRDAELLQSLPPGESNAWASRALRTLLKSVADGQFSTFPFSVTDAWTDGDEAFCVVYTPPLGGDLVVVGHRRQRGDKRPDPWVLFDPERPRYARDGFDPEVGLATPDDAEEFGWVVADDIGDSLGVFAKHLRYDSEGLGWWGTLADALPVRPAR